MKRYARQRATKHRTGRLPEPTWLRTYRNIAKGPRELSRAALRRRKPAFSIKPCGDSATAMQWRREHLDLNRGKRPLAAWQRGPQRGSVGSGDDLKALDELHILCQATKPFSNEPANFPDTAENETFQREWRAVDEEDRIW